MSKQKTKKRASKKQALTTTATNALVQIVGNNLDVRATAREVDELLTKKFGDKPALVAFLLKSRVLNLSLANNLANNGGV